MAIDGTKIIDSDLAHDVYGEFMDLYDAGLEITDIQKNIDKWKKQGLDDEEHEIFITTYALALWEIGYLTDEILEEVKIVITRGSGIKMWLEESGPKDAKKRENELKKFLEKITIPKAKPRKRKKYKKIENFLFNIDDILAFQLADRSYRSMILVNIDQYRGRCNYWFTPTDYTDEQLPNEADIRKAHVFMNKIGVNRPRNEVKQMQPGIEKYWEVDEDFKMPFTLGLSITAIEHKDLIGMKDKFTLVGKIKIIPAYNKLGSLGYEASFDDLSERFTDITKRQIKNYRNIAIPVSKIAEKPAKSYITSAINMIFRSKS